MKKVIEIGNQFIIDSTVIKSVYINTPNSILVQDTDNIYHTVKFDTPEMAKKYFKKLKNSLGLINKK